MQGGRGGRSSSCRRPAGGRWSPPAAGGRGASCHSPSPLTSRAARAARSLEPKTLFQNQLFLQSPLFSPLLHPSRHPAPTDGAGETTVPTAPAPASAAARSLARRAPTRPGLTCPGTTGRWRTCPCNTTMACCTWWRMTAKHAAGRMLKLTLILN